MKAKFHRNTLYSFSLKKKRSKVQRISVRLAPFIKRSKALNSAIFCEGSCRREATSEQNSISLIFGGSACGAGIQCYAVPPVSSFDPFRGERNNCRKILPQFWRRATLRPLNGEDTGGMLYDCLLYACGGARHGQRGSRINSRFW
jgi:hypothetical protein